MFLAGLLATVLHRGHVQHGFWDPDSANVEPGLLGVPILLDPSWTRSVVARSRRRPDQGQLKQALLSATAPKRWSTAR